MELAVGFGLTIAVGTVFALIIGRGEAEDHPLPWVISDLARMQSGLMTTLGAVSITGIVLLVGLFARSSLVMTERLETLALMFALTFGYFVQSAFTLSYLPARDAVGERLHRLYFALATTLQWRTVVMLSMALWLFAEHFEMPTTARILLYLVPGTIAAVSILIAVLSDALGLVRFGECLLSLLVGLVLAGVCAMALRQFQVQTAQPMNAVSVTYAVISGSAYVGAGVVPLASRRPRLREALTRQARRVAMIDMQATGASLAFLWLAAAGVIR